MDKQLVTDRFARSLGTYEQHATIQRQMAEQLIDWVRQLHQPQESPKWGQTPRFDRVLEIGCGTGLLTRLFAEQLGYDRLYLNDLVQQCGSLTAAIRDSVFLPGDIERVIDLPGDSPNSLPNDLNLVLSSATVQWVEDLPRLFDRLADRMANSGMLALSTFGPDNLHEMSAITGISLRCPSANVLHEYVSNRFEITRFEQSVQTLGFKHPTDVLKHLRMTGVTGIQSQRWTRANLQRFCDEYQERFALANGNVTLSYHPITLVASLRDA